MKIEDETLVQIIVIREQEPGLRHPVVGVMRHPGSSANRKHGHEFAILRLLRVDVKDCQEIFPADCSWQSLVCCDVQLTRPNEKILAAF